MSSRNRAETERRILNAVGQLLAKEGFRGVGVNAIARQAGVDKALIYRYFGGLDPLLDAFAASGIPAVDLSSLADAARLDSEPWDVAASSVITGYARALRNDAILQEIMRWELNERNELSDKVAASREQASLEVLDAFKERYGRDDLDLAAIAAVLGAGLAMLTLRGNTYPEYNGVPIATESGWERIEAAVRMLLHSVAGKRSRASKVASPKSSKKKKPAPKVRPRRKH